MDPAKYIENLLERIYHSRCHLVVIRGKRSNSNINRSLEEVDSNLLDDFKGERWGRVKILVKKL